MKSIIFASIFIFFSDSFTYFYMTVFCYSKIAKIEQFMQVGAQQKTIINSIWT